MHFIIFTLGVFALCALPTGLFLSKLWVWLIAIPARMRYKRP